MVKRPPAFEPGVNDFDALVDSWTRIEREVPQLDESGRQLAIPAPNAIEWVTGRNWLNVPSTFAMWGQYQLIRDFFQLRCPLCNEGGSGPNEPGWCWGKSQESLEAEVLLVHNTAFDEDVCPKCGVTRSELTEDKLITTYNQLHLVVGQRAGKSVVAAMMGTYIEHRVVAMGLGHPKGFAGALNLQIPDPYEMTFIASNFVQAGDTIWAKYTSMRAESPWFQRLIPWIKSEQEKQEIAVGMKPWRYAEFGHRIVNQHPRVRLICSSRSTTGPGLRGATRPAAFTDEISHMNQTDSKMSAKEVYKALERSLRTMRTRTRTYGGPPWLGAMISVTSPMSRDDYGMELLRIADRVPSMLALHFPTWEFNPFEPLSTLQEEFDKDPIGAKRDFGAQPPGGEYPLIPDEIRWRKLAVDENLKPTALFTTNLREEGSQKYIEVKLTNSVIHIDGAVRYIAWDAGATFDAFTGACAHGETYVDDKGTVQIKTVYDWVIRLVPPPGYEVRFACVVDVVRKYKLYARIGRVEFDHWQSKHLVQEIRGLGVFAEEVATTSDDYVQFRIDSYSGLVAMLPPDPAEYKLDKDQYIWTAEPPQLTPAGAAVYEMLGLECDPDTHKVSNRKKGLRRGWNSNDAAQVCAHVHHLVQTAGYTLKHDDNSKRAKRVRAEVSGREWDTRGSVLHIGSPQMRQLGRGRGW